jgi:hypothetical protein
MNRRTATAYGQRAPNLGSALRFTLIPFDQITLDPSPAYLVRDLIPREGLVVIWGQPKCGKSFWTFDLMLHVALGWDYRGHRVRQGDVVYIACEGERGLAARAAAFRRRHIAEDGSVPTFHLLATRLDLVADQQPLIDDITAQLGETKPTAVVIDTLNRSIAGSESSDEDMGSYIKAADAIREAFKCAVLIVHHCGIDDKRPRGHTSLTGASDAQIAIRRDGAGLITSAVEWMKDGAEGAETCSRLEVVELGTDEDGEPITSCVVGPDDGAGTSRDRTSKPKVTGAAKVALDLLRRAIDEVGEIPPASNHIPAGFRAVTEDTWRDYCYKGTVSKGETQSARQKAFRRAAENLQSTEAIGTWGGWLWLRR